MMNNMAAPKLAILCGMLLMGGTFGQYIPASTGVVVNRNGGSSLIAFPSPTTGLISLTATLASCTGLQIHTHNESELAYASLANKNPIKMVFMDGTGAVQSANIQPGERFAIPAGLVHYQYNPGCSPAAFVATLLIDASTQLTLGALANVPATDYSTYATSPAAEAVPGFFATNQACVRSCSSGGR